MSECTYVHRRATLRTYNTQLPASSDLIELGVNRKPLKYIHTYTGMKVGTYVGVRNNQLINVYVHT